MVIIPNLPTDNLYKFMALSGLAILFLSVSLFNRSISSIEDQAYLTNLKIADFDGEVNLLLKKISRLDKIVDNSFSDAGGVTYDKSKKLTLRYSDEEIKVFLSELLESESRVDVARRKVNIEKERRDQLYRKFESRIFWSFVFDSVGCLLASNGFLLWYIRVQRPVDVLQRTEVQKLNK